MQSINQSSGIHCKVATQNEVRRFVLSNTDYESLINQVCQVFGFSKDSVVIKYADDEGDFITVSSDEEVKFAIENVKGGVLRLRVERKQPFTLHEKSPDEHPKWRKRNHHDHHDHHVASEVVHPANDAEFEEDESESSDEHPKWRKRNHHNHHDHHDHHNHHDHHDHHDQHYQHDHHDRMMENPAALEKCLQRMKQKRVKLQEKLVYLDSAAEKGNLGNHQHRHREKLRGKIAFVSSRIERLTEVASRQPVANPEQPQPSVNTPSSPQQPSVFPQQPVLAGPKTMPTQDELLAEYETLLNSITSLKFALREAHLQLQLRRTNLQAATYRRNDDSSASPVGPLPSEEQIKELKDALATAKANEAAAKADLQAQVQKLHLVQHQLKAFKHAEKAIWKAKKAEKWQEKAAWRADKHHQHPHGRRNYYNAPQPVVQGSVSASSQPVVQGSFSV